MTLSWKIAWRYLFGKKSTNAIQIITGISVFGLGFGAAAIILILSVFNGFETLLLSMYGSFNPDIKITAVKGKSFEKDDQITKNVLALPEVDSISLTLEELALFEYKNRQEVGTLKGVDDGFNYVTGLDTAITRGEYLIQDEGISYGLFGLGMAYKLGLNIHDRLSSVSIYLLNTRRNTPVDKQFNASSIYPGGTFSIQQEVDYEYVIIQLRQVQRLTKKSNAISAIEIKLKPDTETAEVIKKIEKITGPELKVEDRLMQQSATIKVMRIEKWLAFIILLLALVLVAFNLVGAIWMIVLDKRKDIAVLQAMGARSSLIRSIVLKLGGLICFIGFGMGLFLAILFYYIHKRYGLIQMGPQAMVDAYPMELYVSDLPIVGGLVLFIGLLAVLLPAYQAGRYKSQSVKLS